jgi:hypothetical protein
LANPEGQEEEVEERDEEEEYDCGGDDDDENEAVGYKLYSTLNTGNLLQYGTPGYPTLPSSWRRW